MVRRSEEVKPGLMRTGSLLQPSTVVGRCFDEPDSRDNKRNDLWLRLTSVALSAVFGLKVAALGHPHVEIDHARVGPCYRVAIGIASGLETRVLHQRTA